MLNNDGIFVRTNYPENDADFVSYTQGYYSRMSIILNEKSH